MEFGIMISTDDNYFYSINLATGDKLERLSYWYIQLRPHHRAIALQTVGMSVEEHTRLTRLQTIRKNRPVIETQLSSKWGQLAKSVSRLPESGKVRMRPVMNEARSAMNNRQERKALAIIKRATTMVINLHVRNHK